MSTLAGNGNVIGVGAEVLDGDGHITDIPTFVFGGDGTSYTVFSTTNFGVFSTRVPNGANDDFVVSTKTRDADGDETTVSVHALTGDGTALAIFLTEFVAAPITTTRIIVPANRRPPFTDDSYLDGTTWDDPSFQDVVIPEPPKKVAWFDHLTEFD